MRILLQLALALPFAVSAQEIVREPFTFTCNAESLMALKALYLCQLDNKITACGSLSGFLAGRPVTRAQADQARQMLSGARGRTLIRPRTGI